MQQQIGPGQRRPQSQEEETPFFWYLIGASLIILIANDLSHIFFGEGLWYNISNFFQ